MTAHEPTRTFVLRCTALAILCAVALVWPFRCAAEPHPNVVVVRASTGTGRAFVGSGTLIGKMANGQGAVLTCFHTFANGAQKITVAFPGGRTHIAKLVAHDPVLDLSLLTINEAPSEGTQVLDAECEIGEQVWIAGYGGENGYLEQPATAMDIDGISFSQQRYTGAMRVSARARQGDSGGPILDSDGLVCGVIAIASKDGWTGGTSGVSLCQFVQSNCQGGDCWRSSPSRQSQRPNLTPVAPRPRQERQPATAAPRPDIDPTRPVTPPGRSDDIQAIKAALDKLTAEVAAGRCKCDREKPEAPAEQKPKTDAQVTSDVIERIASRVDKLEKAPKPKPCNCDPIPKPAEKVRHIVVVANQQADTWPRLRDEINRAKQAYSGIQVADPPASFSVPLPQLVAYEDRVPVKVISGRSEVSNALALVARGDLFLFPGEK